MITTITSSLIKIVSLVKLFGVIYFIYLPRLILVILLVFHDIFMSFTCLTDQMVNTRSGSGVDQPPVQR